jgi:glycosyltransferase involved in cell wall biosynthesis
MHVAQFVQRYPPAIGGSEAYAERLCSHLAARDDTVTVWTTTAIELAEMWGPIISHPIVRSGDAASGARDRRSRRRPVLPPRVTRVCRYRPLRFPGRRYVLKALSLVPVRPWQCLTTPCNPVCPAMWRDAGRYDGPLDAVHATAFPYAFPILCGLRLARRRGVPFLLTPFLHLGDPADPADRTRKRYTAPHLRWLLRQADRVFVQTRLERDAAVGLGVPPDRVVLQGLGVEPAECTGGDRDAARRSWGVSAAEVVVGHLANNSAEKGTVDLLRAAERAWAAGHRFRVILAGPEIPSFRSFWDRFGPKHRVTRLGVLTEARKRDFFAGIDLFALPSRSDSFGLVLLEAWANGKPNLVYRAGGPAELVRDGADGLHARCGDWQELAAKLGALVADPGLRRLGDNGLSRVTREFRWADKLELVRETIVELATHRLAVSPPGTPPDHGSLRITKSISPVGRRT